MNKNDVPQTIKLSIQQALFELGFEENDIQIDRPAKIEHGDFSCNIALRVSGQTGKSPKVLAEQILKKISKPSFLFKMEIAGPGFINFYLSQEYLTQELRNILLQGRSYGASDYGKGESVIIEYSSPNIAKQFSVGHLRSTIIGHALANLYRSLGFKVIGENHLGDWGTQFGMIIAAVIEKNLDISQMSVSDIEQLYIETTARAKEDGDVKKRARDWFKKLELGDEAARTIWEIASKKSLSEFSKIYQLLGVEIEYAHGESFYENRVEEVVKEATEKKLTQNSQGAIIIELEEMPPILLRKSDGATTYHTRDLAALKYRIEKWNPNQIIYEVGSEQGLHFRQVFEAARLLGWLENRKMTHVGHGLFLFEGKKMSTRKGTTVKLEDVLLKSIEKAKLLIRGSETGRGLTEEQKEQVAKSVGIGAVKYYDLSHNPISTINFQWDVILNSEGNTGPYLQYAFARTRGVLDKVDGDYAETGSIAEFNNDELLLMKKLTRFPETIIHAAEKYSPNHLCEYLFDLAQSYNGFYARYNILNPAEQPAAEIRKFRIALTAAVGQVLQNGLSILGVDTPAKL